MNERIKLYTSFAEYLRRKLKSDSQSLRAYKKDGRWNLASPSLLLYPRYRAIGRASMAASKVLSFMVYQATPRDPLILAGVIVTRLLVGLPAAWVPALRALATDPSILLREE